MVYSGLVIIGKKEKWGMKIGGESIRIEYSREL